jgi:hypothetical protein
MKRITSNKYIGAYLLGAIMVREWNKRISIPFCFSTVEKVFQTKLLREQHVVRA